MERVELRGTGLMVSRICFGAEPLGGYEWGEVDVSEIERAVETALELGVNFFDTADCYGRGESERRLARVLSNVRDRAVIASKFGVRFDKNDRAFYDNSPEYIEAALAASLKRLGTDYIDLYQLHWADGHTPLETVFEVLEGMWRAGKIRAYGVTNIAPDVLRSHVGRPGLASFSLQYSLACREQEDDIRGLCDAGLTFLSWGSLGQGILSGRYGADHRWREDDRRRRPQYVHFHGDRLKQNLSLVERLHRVVKRENYTSPAVGALRFILDRLPTSIAIVGVKSCAQIQENAKAGLRAMSADSLAELVRGSTGPVS